MKPSNEMLEAYKSMMASAPATMQEIIKAHLVANCRKYDEKLFDRCFEYMQETVMEMLGGQETAVDNKLEGAIPADIVFRICRDYFNDEIWKKEEEEQAEKDRRQKEAAEKKAAKKAAKKAPKKKVDPKIRKATADFEKEQLDKERERIEKLKAKHVVKVIKPEKVLTSGNVKTSQDVKTPEQTLAEKMKAVVEENNRKLGISEAKPIDMFSEAV